MNPPRPPRPLRRVAACLALALALPAAPAAGEGGSAAGAPVEVRVVEASGPRRGLPVPGARVAATRVADPAAPLDPDPVLGGAGASAGADGGVAVAAPAGEGATVIVAVAPGYAPGVVLADAAKGAARVALREAAPGDIEVLGPGGVPVPGASVELLPAAGYEGETSPPVRRRVRTGPDGRARVPDLPSGIPWRVEVEGPGGDRGAVPYLWPGGGLVRVELAVAGSIRGRCVRVPGGAPVPGVRVRAGGREAVTGADGTFLLEGVEPGFAALEVRPPAGLLEGRRPPSLRVLPGETADAGEIRLALPGSARLRVVDAAGAPVTAVRARLVPSAASPAAAFALPGPGGAPAFATDARGLLVVGAVPPVAGHRLLLEPPAPYAAVLTAPFAVLPGEETDLGEVAVPRAASVAGAVADVRGDPVPGARVVAVEGGSDPLRVAADPGAGGPLRREALAAEDGTFLLEGIPPGRLLLLALAPGHLPAEASVEAPPGARRTGVALVLRAGSHLAGRLLDADGAPLADALLLARDGAGHAAGRARTGPDGAFRVEGLRPGVHALVVQGNPAEPEDLWPRFAEDAPSADLELRVPRRAVLRGRAEDDAGAGVEGVVHAALLRGAPDAGSLADEAVDAASAEAGPDGRFALPPLPPGRWRLRFEGTAGGVAAADATVPERGEPAEVLLVTRASSALRGRVITALTGAPAAGARVHLRVAGRAAAVTPPAESGPDGTFLLRGVPAGAHDLLVTHPSASPLLRRSLRVDEGAGVVDLGDLLLEEGARLRVRVFGEDRAPLSGVPVSAAPPGRPRSSGTTGPAGVVLLSGLAPGGHEVEARLPGGAILRRRVDLESAQEREVVFDLALAGPGTVRVTRAARPLAGARVRVEGPWSSPEGGDSSEATTDEAGLARLARLPHGAVRVSVTPAGEPTVRLDAASAGGELALDLPSDGLEIRVAAEEGGGPVAGARVRLLPGGAAEERAGRPGDAFHGVADGEGRVRFPSLVPGDYAAEVEAPGRATLRTGLHRVVAGAGATRVEVLLPRAARVRGVVRGPGRAPVAGAAVEASEPRTGRLLPGGLAMAGADGTFDMAGLPPGGLVLTARAPGIGSSPPESLSLAPGETRTLDLLLSPGGMLDIVVVGAGGFPLAGAEVEVRDFLGAAVPLAGEEAAPGRPSRREGTTGPDGVVRVEGLRAGVYLVRARLGAVEETVRVRVDAREGARAVVTVLPPAPEREIRAEPPAGPAPR